MNNSKVFFIALATMAIASSGLASGNKHTNHTVIDFQMGQDQLTQTAKDSLARVVNHAKSEGQIATVEVAVWSDQPLPTKVNEELTQSDRDLADNRADQIESYLKDTLNVSSIKTFNMAETTNWLARAFRTDAAELKSTFSKQEEPQMMRMDFNIIRESGAAGKAVIVVTQKMVQAP